MQRCYYIEWVDLYLSQYSALIIIMIIFCWHFVPKKIESNELFSS